MDHVFEIGSVIGSWPEQYFTALRIVSAEYNTIAEFSTKGAIIRSRIRWHENSEKDFKYFLNLEKRRNKSHILKLADDTEINVPKAILEQGKMFYETSILLPPATARTVNHFLKILILLNSKQLNKGGTRASPS